ncbi:MAG: DegT/DnrJ/EryC1/StrS family aminotransferase [Bacteroidota bacterium]
MNLQMVDVAGQYRKIREEVDAALREVVQSGQFILGKPVGEFECAAAGYLGVRQAVGCASGTDALQVALMALGVGSGDEVITTPFTFVATTETIVLLGARPVYVDIDPRTFNMDPHLVERAVTPRTRALLPVHLYGQAADMGALGEIARRHRLRVIEDAAQAMGATFEGKKVCGFGDCACISFFPSKNLGAFGDGGMVVTPDEELGRRIRMITLHGSRERYHHEVLGVNSRLDTLQAAVLNVKLKYLDAWNAARRQAADRYDALLAGSPAVLPWRDPRCAHIFHQYTVRLPRRDALAAHLAACGIPHAVYYPVPLHLQRAYAHLGGRPGMFPETERAAGEVISLPMHTELTEEQQQHIAGTLMDFYR